MRPPRGSISGVIPVVEVPFVEDEQVDHAGFQEVVGRQIAAGVDGLMFPGFASEFHKLSARERRELTQSLLSSLAAVPGGPIAVVSVSDHATNVAVREAQWAVEAGASALNVLPPFLFGPSPAAVIAHLDAVLEAVAPTPVIIQHAPAQAGGHLGPRELAELAAKHPNLSAVKVESQPPGRLVSLLGEQQPRLESLVGYAGLHAIDALDRGAVGIQPGCSFSELYVELWRRWTGDDREGARELHAKMLPYLSAWMQHVELIVAVEKQISVERGWFTHATVRTPGWTLDDREHATIEAFLEEFGRWLT